MGGIESQLARMLEAGAGGAVDRRRGSPSRAPPTSRGHRPPRRTTARRRRRRARASLRRRCSGSRGLHGPPLRPPGVATGARGQAGCPGAPARRRSAAGRESGGRRAGHAFSPGPRYRAARGEGRATGRRAEDAVRHARAPSRTPKPSAWDRGHDPARPLRPRDGELEQGEHGQAVLEFDELVRTFPADPLAAAAQFRIGEAYYAARDFERATVEYRKAVDLAPKGKDTPQAAPPPRSRLSRPEEGVGRASGLEPARPRLSRERRQRGGAPGPARALTAPAEPAPSPTRTPSRVPSSRRTTFERAWPLPGSRTSIGTRPRRRRASRAWRSCSGRRASCPGRSSSTASPG